MKAKAQRGQALVEAVLGILVFITILLVGIHFAEVGYLSLKAQEAAASALWESTGRRGQTAGVGASGAPFLATVAALGPAETAQYADFDGLRSSAGGGATVSQLFTRGRGMQVTCQNQSGALNFAPTATVAPLYLPGGGIGCTAQAVLDAPGLPRSFMETGSGGNFKKPQYPGLDIPICAVGRAVNGTCTGSYSLMTNDWGYAGVQNGLGQLGMDRDCPIMEMEGGCPNSVYRDAVQSIYRPAGAQASVDFANTHAGAAPTSAAEFNFAFGGIESRYRNASAPGLSGGVFVSGGADFAEVPAQTSASCFLGVSERGRQGCQ